MSLPYREAYTQMRKGQITWQEYLQNLLARFRGVEHDEDDVEGVYWGLLDVDPFGYSIWCWSEEDRWNTKAAVEDTAPIEAVLMACHQGHLEEVKQNITSIDEKDASWMSATLAFLALKERRADILQFCFDQGNFPFESFFEEEANRVKKDKDPETFEVLEKSRFREMHPRKARHYKKYRRNESPRTRAAGTFDSGGSHPIPW